MPTYEYRCEACSHQFEVFARMSDPAPDACESCRSGTLVKVLFPVAVHYRGSGFYSTDYSGSRGSAGSADGDSSGSGGADAPGSSGESPGSGTSGGSSGSSPASSPAAPPSSSSGDS